jgi:hypothetical protein
LVYVDGAGVDATALVLRMRTGWGHDPHKRFPQRRMAPSKKPKFEEKMLPQATRPFERLRRWRKRLMSSSRGQRRD